MKRHQNILQTPMSVKTAHCYLKRLDFVGFINRSVQYDAKQVNLTPGQLALSVILSTFCTARYPLSRISQHFQSMDTELLFGKGVQASDLHDDAIARMLDNLYNTGLEKLYSELALTSLTQFDIPLGNLHADTSSHAFYGDYDACEKDAYEGPVITHGFSKEHRPDLKQSMVGNIVTSEGIPIVHKTLDGNTSDCLWNQEAIVTLADILKERLREVVYIADSKLVTEPNFKLMNQYQVRFISRVPDSFCAKLAGRIKQEAYAVNQWKDLGKIVQDEYHTQYYGYQCTRMVGMEMMRFLVVKSSSKQEAFVAQVQKEREKVHQFVRELEKQTFSCEPDAISAADRLIHRQGKGFFTLSYTTSANTMEKRPPGNPGKTPKPLVQVTTWKVKFQIEENTARIETAKQQAESFVLITNISSDEMDDKTLLCRYKGQYVVEVGFRMLRQPNMAAIIFLKKPERIAALMMLLHVALLIRALMQQQVRMRNAQAPEGLRDLDNRKIPNPTAEKVLVLFLNHGVVTDRGEYYYCHCSDKEFERMQKLLQLLGITEEELLAAA